MTAQCGECVGDVISGDSGLPVSDSGPMPLGAVPGPGLPGQGRRDETADADRGTEMRGDLLDFNSFADPSLGLGLLVGDTEFLLNDCFDARSSSLSMLWILSEGEGSTLVTTGLFRCISSPRVN